MVKEFDYNTVCPFINYLQFNFDDIAKHFPIIVFNQPLTTDPVVKKPS